MIIPQNYLHLLDIRLSLYDPYVQVWQMTVYDRFMANSPQELLSVVYLILETIGTSKFAAQYFETYVSFSSVMQTLMSK